MSNDPYLRFYFRFIQPNLELIEEELKGTLWEIISDQIRSFVGLTAFEDLCREWTLIQARARRLPFSTEIIGTHWGKGVQIDVVAISWREKAILLGECKWEEDTVGRDTIRKLIEVQTPKVLEHLEAEEKKQKKKGEKKAWQIHYAFFARSGFTDAARAEAEKVGAMLVDLETLDRDLRRAL